MKKVIAKQLGAGIFEELDIDPEPISAASMGQVYRAVRRKDGEKLAVKVQYPGVDAAIDHDLKAIQSVLALTKLLPKTPAFDDFFKEIRTMLKHEADYGRELEHLQFFREQLRGDDRLVVPKVYPEYSTKRVVTMSWEEGAPIDSPDVFNLSQNRRNRIGATLIDLMYREMFEWRVVQTDCHFGNFRIRIGEGGLPDQIVLYDFGAMRKLPKQFMDTYARLILAAATKDFEGVARAGLDIGVLRESDSDEQVDLFVDLCFQSLEPFEEQFASPSIDGSEAGDNPYRWAETDLIERLSLAIKDAIFAFKFRPPPREVLFLNRKMVGTFFFLRKIRFEFGPRDLTLKYVLNGSGK